MCIRDSIEIAQETEMLPITQIAEKAGIDDKYLEQYGKYKAKIDYNLLKETNAEDGKLIPVSYTHLDVYKRQVEEVTDNV